MPEALPAGLPSTNCASDAGPAGRVEPRLWTPPLRPLDRSTSYGFDVIDFACDVLLHPPDPWQRWLLIHACELLPDGRPRFRTVLVLVARQNGKTEVPVMLSAFWQFVEGVPLVLGTSTKIEYAKESWFKAVRLVEGAPALRRERDRRWTRKANGEVESWSREGARYKIAASNEEGGRSLTVHRLVLDELRQHRDYSAYDAAYNAGNAVRDFQCWALSNAGDDRSVVLNDLRDLAEEEIVSGTSGDSDVGLFEYSAPADADPLDVGALAQANPNLDHRVERAPLLAAARRAVRKGGAVLTGFKTEVMCIRVRALDPAIDPDDWKGCLDVGDLAAVRSRVALFLDVAPDELHATLAAAAVLADGRVRVEVVQAWSGVRAVDELRRALPDIAARVRPRAVGWFPGGPAAGLAADLADRPGGAGRRRWPPPGVVVEEIRGDIAAVCMGFRVLVVGRHLAHSGDPLLDAHVATAERRTRGADDAWVFHRRGAGHCDAVYAGAGAVHLARMLPAPIGKPRLVLAPGTRD